MAGVAGSGGLIFVEVPCMAPFTGRGAMLAKQRVLGVSVVIEGYGFPILFAMAFLAFVPEGGSVDVVFLMAGIAVGRRLVFVQRALVAAVALGISMIALEGVRRVAIVLKEQRLPIPFGVAAFALLAVPAFVLVVFLVARDAVDRGFVLIELSLMAGVAGGRDMPSPQRIFRVKVVVECDGLPVVLSMTRFAFLSVRPFVLVDFFVTGIAFHRRILEGRREVAFLTFCGGVFPHQGEARLVMVERRLLP